MTARGGHTHCVTACMRPIGSTLAALGFAASVFASNVDVTSAEGGSGASALPSGPAAGPDATAGLPGRWQPIRSSHCANVASLEPDALGALAFVGCPSNPDGCMRLAPRERVDLGEGTEVVRLARGAPAMAYARMYPGPGGAGLEVAVNVVEPLGGKPVLAVAGPAGVPSCRLSSHVGEWGFALSAVPYAGQHGPVVFAWAPWSEPGALRIDHVVLTWAGAPAWVEAADVPAVAVGAHTLFVQTELGVNGPLRGGAWSSNVRLLDPSSGRLGPTTSSTGAKSPAAVRDGAIVIARVDGQAGLAFIGSAGAITVLRRPPPSYEVTCFAVDRTRGKEAVVWIEKHEIVAWLYTAPLASLAGASGARRIGAMVDPCLRGGVVANGGEALSVEPDGSARITDLQSGVSSSRPPEAPDRFRRPLWIDERDIWLATDDGIVRLARSTKRL